MKVSAEKTLPHDLVAEAAILFSVLYAPESILEVTKSLTPQDLYSRPLRAVLGAAMAIHGAGGQVDVVTVGAKLNSDGKLEEVGGMDFLESLLDYSTVVAGVGNLKSYIRTVKEKSLVRQLISLCRRIATDGYRNGEYETMSADLIRQLGTISAGAKEFERPVWNDAVSAAKTSLRAHANRLKNGIQLSTGLKKLDEFTGGYHRKNLTVIAGRASMGKTALMTNTAITLAKYGHVLIFSLEMPESEIADRILCNLSGLQMSEICDVRVDGRAIQVQDAIYRISPRIKINDWCSNTYEMVAKVKAFKAELNKVSPDETISAVMLDHLGKVNHPYANNDHIAIGKTTHALKELAKEEDLSIIALCQINRGVESRDNKRPTMSDLSESGKIEQDADNILLLYRDEYYTKEKCQCPGVVELIIAKQRNGPTETVLAAFEKKSTTFKDLEDR